MEALKKSCIELYRKSLNKGSKWYKEDMQSFILSIENKSLPKVINYSLQKEASRNTCLSQQREKKVVILSR